MGAKCRHVDLVHVLDSPNHPATIIPSGIPQQGADGRGHVLAHQELSTTIGETFADYLSVQVGLGPGVTDGVMMPVLAVTLVAQLRTRRFVPWLYWLTVVPVSIVGPQITDFFTDVLGVPLAVSTAVFAVFLAVVFTIWWRQERTLAITPIDTPSRERFYWDAILTTFALGTAGGDFATEGLSLGFCTGVLIFGGLILAVWAPRRFGVITSVPAFWIAYVLSRPLGASRGDLLTQDHSYGGVGLGASVTSLVFVSVIVALVTREQVNVLGGGLTLQPTPRTPCGTRARIEIPLKGA